MDASQEYLVFDCQNAEEGAKRLRRVSWFLLVLFGFLLCMPESSWVFAQEGKAAAVQEKITTNFTILVGFPAEGQQPSEAALLVPGTVIPLDTPGATGKIVEQNFREKSLSFTQAVEKLWSTFRLDAARRQQKSLWRAMEAGKTVELPSLEGTGISMDVVAVSWTSAAVTYRVVFRQGEKSIANSTVSASRGGRTVVGGMDGEAAPYIFLILEPELPTSVAEQIPAGKKAGITEPVPVQKVNPSYPEEAKKQKITGIVIVEVIVDEEGRVLNVRIVEEPHPSLGSAAAEAIRQWIFTPGRLENGAAVKVRASITVVFKLQ